MRKHRVVVAAAFVALAALAVLPARGNSPAGPTFPRQRHFDNARAETADLDGDGAHDLATVTSLGRAVVVRAYSGRSGKPLWTLPVRAEGAGIVGALVGTLARPGVLVSTGGPDGPGLMAVDASGAPVWSSNDPAPGTAVGRGAIVGLANVVEGAADDVVVERSIDAPGAASTIAELIDGRTGIAVTRLSTPNGSLLFRVAAVGDLDRDGIQDIIFYSDAADRSVLRAFSSRTGRSLWNAEFADEDYLVPADAGDIDGDGRSDVLARWDGTFRLLSGLGRQMRRFPDARSVQPAGDLNGDRLPDLAVTSRSIEPSQVCAVFEGVSDRSTIYRTSRCLPYVNATDMTSAVSGSEPVGDLDGDGIADYRYGMWVCEAGRCATENGFVSGRRGAIIRLSSLPVSAPLHASVDGRGDDFASQHWQSTPATVSAFDGRDGSLLWSGECGFGEGTGAVHLVPMRAGIRPQVNVLCDAIFYDEAGVESRTLTMLSGIDGTTRWTRRVAPYAPLD